MISITNVDIEFYDILSDPVIVIGEGNKVLYCNERAIGFLRLSSLMDIIEHPLSNFINFIGDEEIKFEYEFLKQRKVLNRVKISVSTYFNEKISAEIVGKQVIYEGTEAVLLVFKIQDIFKVEHKVLSNYFVDVSKISAESEEKDENITVNGLDNLSETTMRTLISQTPTAIVTLKQGRIIFANKSGLELIGKKTDAEVIGKEFFDLVQFDLEGTENIIGDLHKLSISDSMLPVVQRKITRKDGTQIYAELTAMSFKEQGELLTIFIGRNVTKKVIAEKNLQRNQANYSKLLEFMPFGVAIYNEDKFTFCNDALFKIMGFKSLNEINKKEMRTYVHNESLDVFRKIRDRVYEEVQQSEFEEMILKRKNGTKVQVELGAVPIFFDNKMSVILVIHDITERKKAERDKFKLDQALKYDKLKTEFISNVSHELKTPLNIILSIVQVLQLKEKENENFNDKSHNKYLSVMKQNCYRLLRLINNLIDITRIDVGYLKMDFGNYNIVKVIEDITLSTVEYIESKGMSIVFDTDVEEKIIGVDRENMERVMLNLLSNAIKFSKENGKIFVNLYDLGDKLRISVKDNGIGIPKKMQGKIFERFVQSESLFTRSHEGSGIGLSLVKSIVEAHGGQVYVKSRENRGSEFVVDLPNILSTKEPNILIRKNGNSNNVQRIEIEFSDIYN